MWYGSDVMCEIRKGLVWCLLAVNNPTNCSSQRLSQVYKPKNLDLTEWSLACRQTNHELITNLNICKA